MRAAGNVRVSSRDGCFRSLKTRIARMIGALKAKCPAFF
jgi:hypothetical protein